MLILVPSSAPANFSGAETVQIPGAHSSITAQLLPAR
jgi:hypothetical protein